MNRRNFLKGTALAGFLPGLLQLLPIPAKEPGRLIEPARVDWEDGWCALIKWQYLVYPWTYARQQRAQRLNGTKDDEKFQTEFTYRGSPGRINALAKLVQERLKDVMISGQVEPHSRCEEIGRSEWGSPVLMAVYDVHFEFRLFLKGIWRAEFGAVAKGEMGTIVPVYK